MVSPYLVQVLTYVGLNCILALGTYFPLSLGQISVAQAAFMSIGAFSSGALSLFLGLPFYGAVLAGAMFAGVTGAIIGYPILRMRGFYLAIATLAFNEAIVAVMNYIVSQQEMCKTALIGMPPATQPWHVLLILGMLIFFFFRFDRSRFGRAFKCISDDEIAVEALGIDIASLKVLSFAVGAFICGLGGALYAHYFCVVTPLDFNVVRSFEFLIFCFVGGSQVFWGPIAGAILLTALPEILRPVAEYRMMVYGGMLLATMLFRPQGLIDQTLVNRIGHVGGNLATLVSKVTKGRGSGS